MKKLIAIIAILSMGIGLHAQVYSGRGTYGTVLPWYVKGGNCYNGQGKATAIGYDTLKNGDTGYVWFSYGNLYNHSVDLVTSVLTGTVSTTSNVLQGNNDSATLTANWQTITGNTTYCTTCVGASSTTVPSGSVTHYIWQIPSSQGGDYKYLRVRTIQTGTCTATYTAKDNIVY